MNSTQTLHLLLLLTLLIILCIGSGGIAATTIEAKEEAVATALRLRHVVKRASIKENLAAIDRVVQHLDNIVQQMGQTEGELHAAASSWQVRKLFVYSIQSNGCKILNTFFNLIFLLLIFNFFNKKYVNIFKNKKYVNIFY
jgi:Ethanolamine utilization protein EutJ (predicted chaperonin)